MIFNDNIDFYNNKNNIFFISRRSSCRFRNAVVTHNGVDEIYAVPVAEVYHIKDTIIGIPTV